MTILGLVLKAYNIIGTGFSIAGGINHAIRHFCQTTAEDLFKKSFEKVVKQHASNFADLTDPKKVEVHSDTFDNVIASLKDVDEIQFTQLNGSEKIAEITTLFRPCIIVPKRQLTDRDIDHRVRPILESIIVDFFAQLPFDQDAFNQIALDFLQKNSVDQKITHSMLIEATREIEQVQSEVSERLTQDIQTIKDHTEKMEDDHEKIKHTTGSNSLDTCLPLISNPELESKCRIGDFDSDLLLDIAKLSNWKISEPYNSFVLALGEERMHLQSALDVAVDFLLYFGMNRFYLDKKNS